MEKGYLYSLDVSAWSNGDAQFATTDVQQLLTVDETAPLGGTTVMTDWFDIEVAAGGDVYIAFYKKIVKYVSGAACR